MISYRIQSVLNFLVFTLVFIIILPFSSCIKEEEKIMKVRNDSITGITNTSAKAHATVIDLGSGIDQHGHCWSTSAELNIDINDGKSELGSANKTGQFTSEMKDLSPDTKYYVRAYVQKSSSVIYCDNILPFRTLTIGMPVVFTDSISDISESGATAHGNLTSLGAGVSSVLQHGHCWSNETTTPTVDDKKTSLGSKSTTGPFESEIVHLSPGELYYVRAYATNIAGTAYGDTTSFITSVAGTVPVVTTGIISNTTQTGATVTGSLDNMGSGFSSVSEHGHCWSSETSTPTINDDKTSLGTRSTTGSFESSLTGLTPDVLYYVRAYATNNSGIGYGNPVSFSTEPPAGVPELTTTPVSSITGTTAKSGGTIISEGGSPITAKGICWSPSSNPTTSDNCTNVGSGSAAFESTMTGLEQQHKYYVMAYAINASGTGYGNEIVFTTKFDCGTRLTDPRDEKTYLTVQIGDQCWMAENLNVGDYITGMKIPGNNSVIEKHCYNDNEANCDLYGALYRWNEMMDHTEIEMTTGICPKGWHIPSDFEWKILEKELGMSQETADSTGWRGTDEGGKLKAAGTTYWEDPNAGATNSSLFTALPAGHVDPDGNFTGLGYNTSYWTSTLIIDTQCWRRYLDNNESRIYRIDGNRTWGASVRCVKDQE
jgi:uncharacterized protein (TIGR02145 family)